MRDMRATAKGRNTRRSGRSVRPAAFRTGRHLRRHRFQRVPALDRRVERDQFVLVELRAAIERDEELGAIRIHQASTELLVLIEAGDVELVLRMPGQRIAVVGFCVDVGVVALRLRISKT